MRLDVRIRGLSGELREIRRQSKTIAAVFEVAGGVRHDVSSRLDTSVTQRAGLLLVVQATERNKKPPHPKGPDMPSDAAPRRIAPVRATHNVLFCSDS